MEKPTPVAPPIAAPPPMERRLALSLALTVRPEVVVMDAPSTKDSVSFMSRLTEIDPAKLNPLDDVLTAAAALTVTRSPVRCASTMTLCAVIFVSRMKAFVSTSRLLKLSAPASAFALWLPVFFANAAPPVAAT